MKKILVGMSGGVDSSVTALLLLQKGYEAAGCTLRLTGRDNGSVEDAASVCKKLGIEHHVINMADFFREKVVDPFVREYALGLTPNPCIMCNRYIKFGKMLERALILGCDGIATGHYAGVRYLEENGKYLLLRGADRRKDQSYVLYNMTPTQLAHTLFPLYGMNKESVRQLAEENGLITARKRDSQDICFVPDGDYARFIEEYTGKEYPAGDFVDGGGNVLGKHNGLIRYTIGQRRGLGTAFGKPLYVCGKSAADNTVTLGEERELYRSELTLRDVNLITADRLEEPLRVTAKTRYSAEDKPATVCPAENGLMRIVFDQPVKAPAAGQACVFYLGDVVVGGGEIRQAARSCR